MFAGDAYRQAKFILEKIVAALADIGASPSDVTRTCMFVTDVSGWEEIDKAHGVVFANIRRAATMFEVSRLIGPQNPGEIEVNAVVSRGSME
ncbi:MAG: hypothetical protein KDA91_08840 [Planctomycetaceae bacterium]|nr:hypothetical protein [Planctomycetaceae bacterium]